MFSEFIDVLDEPDRLRVTSRTSTTISIEWPKVPDADGYEFRYQRYGDEEYILCGEVSTNAVTVVNLEPGQGYNFQVKAVADRLASSLWSHTLIESTRRK